MAYVIVNRKTKLGVRHPRTGRTSYSTQSAAQAALTRLAKTHEAVSSDWVLMSTCDYTAQVPMIAVKSLMTGVEVQISADTPWSCNPSSETYWSM